MKISMIGCGKIGSGMAQKLASDHKVTLFDRNGERTKQFAKTIKAHYTSNPSEAVAKADIIVLAVKPQDLNDISAQIHREINKEQLLVSVLAGVTTQTLGDFFAEIPLLRMMPNIAVRYGQGVIAMAETEMLPQKTKDKAEKAFKTLGALHWIPENKFDALTALTGSGPAFLFMIIESIIDSGIAMGFTAEDSKDLTIQLFHGTLALLEQTGKHPGELKWEVTSPSGTTIAGVKVMEDMGVRSGIINTFLATYQRAIELSRKN